MNDIETQMTNQLSEIIFNFLKSFDQAEFDDEEGNGGHTSAAAISDALAGHLVESGISIDAA